MAVRYTRPLRPRKGPDDIGAPTKAAVHQRRHWRAAHFDDYGNASIVARPLSSTKPPRFEGTAGGDRVCRCDADIHSPTAFW